MAEQRKDYEEIAEPLRSFAPALESLLKEILIAEGVNFHYVRARVKTKSSTSKKLANPRKNYTGLSDLTDLLGVRIVTYFPDDVDIVANLIEREFAVDRANSIDKRQSLAPDRFGYLSMHFVAEIGLERGLLAEYRRFKDLKFEIQIRSILQHAWAEIEHDLGYKSAVDVPDKIKRRFSRLAGLLELADEEFMGIRDELTVYQEKVEQAEFEDYRDVPIDLDSLSVFIRSQFGSSVDQKIAEGVGLPLFESDRTYVSLRVEELVSAGYRTIGQVREKLKELEADVVRFSIIWMGAARPTLFKPTVDSPTVQQFREEPIDSLFTGISLFYLWLLLVARGEVSNPDLHPIVVEEIIKVYDSLNS
ncbi:GTP pyrophosphokinase family protein [Streptomyces sp. ATCC 21386]|uniref:GTP pyrophosphokinase n=1 Tax=Streptomyces sp. ATCC 21386 TaxID=2699428 RepID=UPI001BFEF6F9|nr:hypothetical protein [Streptomyces sp. ATCC 21386]